MKEFTFASAGALRNWPNLNSAAGFLKYAMVEHNVVIVDPASMRANDVNYGNTEL